MKKTVFLSMLFICFFTTSKAQNWLTDINLAKKTATEQKRNIVLVFQGSDWCAPCIKLDKQIWSTDEFKKYAKDHFVLLKADFPRRSKNKLPKEQQDKNNQLAEKYNKQGYFPLVVVLDHTGKVLGTTGYKNVSPSEYIKILNSF